MRKSLANYYAEDMYERDRTGDSARILVPMVVALTHPSSVVDVGCGRGAWLGEFKTQGIDKIVGLDGDYLKASMLRFPPECFRPTDLSSKFEIPGRYDLAICLEVAEHLPPANAVHLVRQLTSAAPQVMFSAAPPGQGGEGHINCQPLSYWRKMFEELGFRMLDPFRPKLRDDRRVAWWYRQNAVLFVSPEAISGNPALADYPAVEHGLESEWVHMFVADAQAAGPGTRARRLTRRVLRRASKALRPKS
ncbi:class I SAM-dependent methyltransferase [Candidatus Binatus sp.]|uniref:class I SAM-dependent methyltransferase n=1 Tax=Candidatus Binatus sp. TaxID=2811406 RepID=UPI003CC5E6D2